MRKNIFLLLAALVIILTGCGTSRTVPLTGRTQHLSISDEQVLSLSNQSYTEYMKTAKKSTDAANTAMVERVGKRLASAVTDYLTDNGYADELSGYSWAFNLVQDDDVNAFCLPGGKIVVYEGLLPVTRDEASLAIVLGHEIAHAVAKHSAERISREQTNQYGTAIVGGLLGASGLSSETQQLAATVFGLGAEYGVTKPFSRKQESEADHMGLIFAAMAGYDPEAATAFWQRMAAESTTNVPAFLSDHPSDANRIKNIQEWMPEALKYYKGASASAKTSPIKAAKTIHIGSK